MANILNKADRDRFLTARWNNALVVGLGLLAVVYVAVVLSTSALSDRWALLWLVLIGAVY